jgi:copper chaperone CopZ
MIWAALVLPCWASTEADEPARRVVVEVEGIHCDACLDSVRNALRRVPGLRTLDVRRCDDDPDAAVAVLEQSVSRTVDREALARWLRGFRLRRATARIEGTLASTREGLVILREERPGLEWRIAPARSREGRERFEQLRRRDAGVRLIVWVELNDPDEPAVLDRIEND